MASTPTSESSLINDRYWTEHALGATTLDLMILPSHLHTDFLLMSPPHSLAARQLHTATGGAARNNGTRNDYMQAALAALLPVTGNSIHNISGPELWT